jgi:signal transduction histidine kinase
MNEALVIPLIISVAGIALLITGFILLQVRNRNRLLQKEKQLAAAELSHQKALLESVITSQEAERKRIGMDLHDEVGAALSTLRLKIEQEAVEKKDTGEFLVHCKSDIDRIITNMRQISHNLSPRISGNFGFYDAVHELSDSVNRSGRIKMQIQFDESQVPVFGGEQSAMALYRVIAELVNNTLKHADAKQILLDVDIKEQRMELHYRDDGRGLKAKDGTKSGGMGMQNIESRLGVIGADWTMQEPEGGGYGLFISVPLK